MIRRRRRRLHRCAGCVERLELRVCPSAVATYEAMDGESFATCRALVASRAVQRAAAEVEPQFVVHQPPRVQLGDAPLVGSPQYDGQDRIDVVWQTQQIGAGTLDGFAVNYRRVGQSRWIPAALKPSEDTQVDTRVMHSATLYNLDWNSLYEYRVQHLRAGAVVESFQHTFRTRLEAGDPRPFSFAAYGDSADVLDVTEFRAVQSRINELDLSFALLLGDNAYPWGTHDDYDARLLPDLSPEAVEWIAGRIDYPAVGNHDAFILHDGRPYRELYSVPVPRAGSNAPAQPPEQEFPEHNYAFDYGDAHFVTFDSNAVDSFDFDQRQARLDALLEYVTADLEASSAHWKIVFAHHPFIGTEKNQQPGDFYFQKMVSRLRQAGADLVVTGHSHTYSWTFPLTAATDRDQDGQISMDEVDYVAEEDRIYAKGAGLIQLVAGVGGGSLRWWEYEEPLFAGAYSTSPDSGPVEFGFARIDVTPRHLAVSYISAATGQIVGDTNGNGIADFGEDHFAQFRIVDFSVRDGDVNGDGQLDVADIDSLAQALRAADRDPVFDVNRDRTIDARDRDALVVWYFFTGPGDANLDGVFDAVDLRLVFEAGQFEDRIFGNATWAEGDWDGDGDFSTRDLIAAFQSARFVTGSLLASM